MSVAFGVLVVVAGLAGIGYTWYMSQQPLPDTAQPKAPAPTKATKVPVRTVNPDAQVGVVLQYMTTPLKPPANAALNAKTNAGATCTISVKYNNVAAEDTGLVQKTADEFGLVQWTWSVPVGTPLGSWPVEITCTNEKNSGYYKAALELVAELPE